MALRWWFPGLWLIACAARPLHVEDLPRDTKLIDVNDQQAQVLCSWLGDLAAARLPPNGTPVTCGEEKLSFVGGRPDCGFNQHFPRSCPATIQDARTCYPAFFDYISAHRCEWLGIRSRADLERIVARVPTCSGLRNCTYPGPSTTDGGTR
jgi:hypothetical protein